MRDALRAASDMLLPAADICCHCHCHAATLPLMPPLIIFAADA